MRCNFFSACIKGTQYLFFFVAKSRRFINNYGKESHSRCAIEKNAKNKKRQKVKRRNEEGLTPKQQELKELKTKVLNLKEQGVSYRKIAENVNITLGKVQRLLK